MAIWVHGLFTDFSAIVASPRNVKAALWFFLFPYIIFVIEERFSAMFNNSEIFFCYLCVAWQILWLFLKFLLEWMVKLYYVKLNKEASWFCSTDLNQLITVSVFFHWLTFSFSISVLLIFSKIILLILPSSDLHGFIKRHGVADLNFVYDISMSQMSCFLKYTQYHCPGWCFVQFLLLRG